MDSLYHDPKLVEAYDAINASRKDFDFYVAELPNAPATILDIGCGTGTLALDIASRGYSVIAVDPAPEMIAAATRKDTNGSVTWVTGLVSDLSDDVMFDTAIMTGHAFQCIQQDSDMLALFEAVEQRLKVGGSFWFETRNPASKPWRRWTPLHAKPPIDLSDGRTVKVVHNLVEVAQDKVTFEEKYHFSDNNGTLTSQSTLRFPERDAIERIAAKSGLMVSETYGNWQREPLMATSPEIIIRLKKMA